MRTATLFLWIINQAIPFENLYLISLILLAGLLLLAGVKLKYPLILTLTLASFVLALFVTGIHLFSFPVKEWGRVLFQQQTLESHPLYLPGGIILAALGLLLLRKTLHLKAAMLDIIVLGLPVIGILQRLDCFITGCCYGKISELPWSVHYPAQSIAWEQQVHDHLLSSSSKTSLGVHPTQLYYVAGFLLTILVLLRFRRRLRKPGSVALLGFILLASLRWGIEFFREPFTDRWYQFTFLSMNGLQYLILLLLVPAVIFLFRRERTFTEIPPLTVPPVSFKGISVVLLISSVLIWNSGALLSGIEYLLLISLLLPALVLTGYRLLITQLTRRYKYAAFGLMALTLLTMSQTVPDTSAIPAPRLSKKYLSVEAAAGGGHYNKIDRGCNGEEIGRTPATYNSQTLSGAFHYIDEKGSHLQAGVTAFRLYDKVLDGNSAAMTMYSATPYFIADFKKIGIGTGFNLMNGSQHGFFPMFMLRSGNREKFFVDANIGKYFPYMGYSALWQVGVGSGFGNYEKHYMRVGVSTMEGKALIYAGGNYNLDNQFSVSANFGVGNTIHGSLGLGYRIPLSTGSKTGSSR